PWPPPQHRAQRCLNRPPSPVSCIRLQNAAPLSQQLLRIPEKVNHGGVEPRLARRSGDRPVNWHGPRVPFGLSPSSGPPMVRGCLLAVLTGLMLLAGGGCQRSASKVAPSEPPVLPVSKPIQREITNYVDFTGRTSAVSAVDIRPRVTGYLLQSKNPFKE